MQRLFVLFVLFSVGDPGVETRAPVLFADDFETGDVSRWSDSSSPWAFEETFDGDPSSPSTELLPDNFDFVVTHRTHPRDHEPGFAPYLADHGDNCAGPTPGQMNVQHWVTTKHQTSGAQPDDSFYICKNHMMSSMGDVEGYSVTAFWPRQEFDFSTGGVIEFDVNINDGHPRSWWELLITPRAGLKVGAAQDWLPIDETYPRERIVLTFTPDSSRQIQVGSGALAPEGWIAQDNDWRSWSYIDPNDPALSDRRIRRKMRVELSRNRILWRIERSDGIWDDYQVDLPNGLPFDRGLVVWKTHAYTPEKDGNTDLYTFHWDNLRFDGPVVGRYEAFESETLVYLQANGSRPIGDTAGQQIELPYIGANPVLSGQINGANIGQVELSINGAPFIKVNPLDYGSVPDCTGGGWATFRLPIAPSQLEVGSNTFTWRVGPRPACLSWQWDGFSVKSLEIQFDR